MNANAPSTRLLLSLLTLGQQDETIDLFTVAEEAGLSLYQALKGLSALSEKGLVDARRLRLTLAGLAITCGLEGAARAAGVEGAEASSERLAATGGSQQARSEAPVPQGAAVRSAGVARYLASDHRSFPGDRAA